MRTPAPLTLYSYPILLLFTPTLYSYSLLLLFTASLYSYSLLLLFTASLYSYSLLPAVRLAAFLTTPPWGVTSTATCAAPGSFVLAASLHLRRVRQEGTATRQVKRTPSAPDLAPKATHARRGRLAPQPPHAPLEVSTRVQGWGAV